MIRLFPARTKLFCFTHVTSSAGTTFAIDPAITLSPTGTSHLYCTDEPVLLLFAAGRNRSQLGRRLADQLDHLHALLENLYLDDSEEDAEDAEADESLEGIASLYALKAELDERIRII